MDYSFCDLFSRVIMLLRSRVSEKFIGEGKLVKQKIVCTHLPTNCYESCACSDK